MPASAAALHRYMDTWRGAGVATGVVLLLLFTIAGANGAEVAANGTITMSVERQHFVVLGVDRLQYWTVFREPMQQLWRARRDTREVFVSVGFMNNDAAVLLQVVIGGQRAGEADPKLRMTYPDSTRQLLEPFYRSRDPDDAALVW